MNKNEIADIAHKYALKSDLKTRYAAILVYRKKIISVGYNHYYGLVRYYMGEYNRFKFSMHAEVDCIMNCKKKDLLPKSTIYIYCVNKDNVAPCEICMKFIERYKIKKIKCF